MFPVIKKASYILAHTPDLIMHAGTTQTTEMLINKDSEYLKKVYQSLRSFDEAVKYAPNQTYIGNITPEELSGLERPWYNNSLDKGERFGKFGEIMPQDEFYGLMKICDVFDLVTLEKEFTDKIKESYSKHPILKDFTQKLKDGVEIENIEKLINSGVGEGLYDNEKLIGFVKRAHEYDKNLSAHNILENLACKASGVLSLLHLAKMIDVPTIEIGYIIECSEEAIGDMNQRGGGNLAKSCGEIAGFKGTTGVDLRGFCAAPAHAIVTAAGLVQSGIYKHVVVFAGGATAKLGMNGKDHVRKGLKLLEDCLGGFAVLISENDGVSPVLRTDVVGRHNIGHGAAPQAVLEALVSEPLARNGMKITDIDKYAPEMQTPDLTEPAGAGDVPAQNYKMIAALAVRNGQLERAKIAEFMKIHGYPGFAPTQGHIPSGVPIIGHGIDRINDGTINNFMIIGKGSLFLGRMTNLFDGISIVIEKNRGIKDITGNIEEGNSPKKISIGLTTLGSELGFEEVVKGAELAIKKYSDFEIVLIGPKVDTKLKGVEASTPEEGHKIMNELLSTGEIQGVVTQHYDFPIGVATVGRVITPARGKEMIIGTTTGTASTSRIEAMVKSAVSSIAVAKSIGIQNPKVGILNVEGSRSVERILFEMKKRGYDIDFSESKRSDGGTVMRGNDLLMGTPDIMICDSLTGNILMKVFSSFTSGGDYEILGYGYGPGVGEGYDRIINIISRASGAPVICEALRFCASCAQGNLVEVAREEFEKANACGLKDLVSKKETEKEEEIVSLPPKKVVTAEIPGIDILDLEDACKKLWKEGIYSESGMGCTGPIILVSEDEFKLANDILKKAGYK